MLLTTRYVFRSLVITTFFVACVLVAAVWMTQSLRLVDILVNHGVTLTTFLSMMLLLIPDLVGVILPFALVIAVLFVYSRLYSDSELIALRAAGLSDKRLALPSMLCALLVTIVLFSINFYFLPASFQKFKDMESQVRRNVSAALIKPGEFITFEGMTVYVRSKERSGKLQGIMIYDVKHNPAFTLVAKEGLLSETEHGARIVLHNGVRHEQSPEANSPSLVAFDKYALDIESENQTVAPRRRKPYERFLSELLEGDPGDPRFAKKLRIEVHQRFLMPLTSFAFVLIAMVTFLLGDYSRRGKSKRISVCIFACALLEIGTFLLLNLGEKIEWMPFVAETLVVLAIMVPGYALVRNDAARPKPLEHGEDH